MADAGDASEAFSALLSQDYSRSHELLANVSKSQSAASRSRVAHNAAVVNLYASGGPGCPDAKPHIRDLVLAAVAALPESERPKSVRQFFAETTHDASALNGVLSACGGVHLYNLAVIAYNSEQINAAAAIGDVLYANVEAMEDWLALRACFLLIDVYLRHGDVGKAGLAGAFAERIIPGFSTTVGSTDKDAPEPDLFPVAPAWKGKTSAVLEPPMSMDDAKFCMHMYNARLSSARDDGKNLRKDAKSAVVAAESCVGRPTACALLVKARMEPNVQKGLRILASVGTQTPPDTKKKLLPIALNSLGIMHHKLGKHALAANYFEQSRALLLSAMKSLSEGGAKWEGGEKDDDCKLSVTRAPHDTHVTYNLALQYMLLGQFREALGMFSACARADEVLAGSSPHIWIRMAECCLEDGRRELEESSRVLLVGRGRGRRLVVETKPRPDGSLFQYAAACARTALAILEEAKKREPTPTVNGVKAGDGKPAEDGQANQLRAITLALIAYASLEFDANAALTACNELVSFCASFDTEREILGHLYGAEAQCILGRPDEAVERLGPLLSMRPPAHSRMRDSAYVNVALAHCMRGDMETATRAAKGALKVTSGQDGGMPRRDALLVSAYVFLRDGDVENARQVLHNLRVSSGA